MNEHEDQPDGLTPMDGETPDDFLVRVTESEGTQEDTTKEPDVQGDIKTKIGDKEYTAEELATLIASGERASEIERGAREKFDAASARQKELDEREAQLADMRIVYDAYRNGTPDEKRLILQELAENTGLSVVDARLQLDNIDEDDLTENEKMLHRRNVALQSDLNRLKAQVAQIGTAVSAIREPLEEIRTYTESEREARQIQSDIAAIKEKTGQEISGETIKAWRDKGITNPVQAIDVLMPMLKAATVDGATKARKQNEIPESAKDDSLDPNDPNVTADDLFREYMRKNQVPGW